jgi:U3 small nucleolar RNA-associated protein 20
MPSSGSSARIPKARRGVKTTARRNTHRWESFTTKISKLHSLDPLRKVRRHDLVDEDLSATTSYLRNGLDRWSELNLSKSFAAFKRELLPLCESLAQILHFENRIMDLLEQYIARHEPDSLEPLLDMLTAFAHDLGTRFFEKHYTRALTLIVALAEKLPKNAEVVEWTFAALAFLFKYLSRLLVPDLRPTYDAVSALLGKEKVPGHVARFAGEAMSFLVKKAATPSSREKALSMLVDHVKEDLQASVSTRQYGLYSQGVMAMFAEAIKGTGHTVHSTGPDTFIALVRAIPSEELQPGRQTVWTDVCCGVLTSVIHHSTSETFSTLEQAITTEVAVAAEEPNTTRTPWRMSISTRILGIVAGVRKGYRISNWPVLTKSLSLALKALSHSQDPLTDLHTPLLWQSVMFPTAIILCRAPIDALLPSLTELTSTLTKEPFMRCSIPFSSLCADLDSGRFRSLFQKSFQRYEPQFNLMSFVY